MMKKNVFLFFIVVCCFAAKLYAQIDCNNGRYHDSLFSVDVIQNVVYGHNYNYLGVYSTLRMDIYLPHGDVISKRPLIIIAPGGSFLVEDKTDYPTSTLCKAFASMGYVTAGIDYRIGVNSSTKNEFMLALIRAMQDYRAAVRFFKKDATTINTYKIDTDIIVAGGSSAGAFSAVHLAYLDKESELLSTGIDTTGLGGLEGLSGNPGYSSKVNYIINLCGAIGDTSWIEPGNIPVISMHGTNDNIVPYGTNIISVGGIPITIVDGSSSIKNRCDNIKIENPFYTFKGAGHTPYDLTMNQTSYLQYMDTTISFIRDNLYNWVCSNVITDVPNINFSASVCPNPFSDHTEITTTKYLNNATLSIFDVTGKTVAKFDKLNGNKIIIARDNFISGIYFYRISENNKLLFNGKILIL